MRPKEPDEDPEMSKNVDKFVPERWQSQASTVSHFFFSNPQDQILRQQHYCTFHQPFRNANYLSRERSAFLEVAIDRC